MKRLPDSEAASSDKRKPSSSKLAKSKTTELRSLRSSEKLAKRVNNSNPTLYTPEIGEKIVEAIDNGLPLAGAAALCGINQSTAAMWVSTGEANPDGPWAEFAQAVRQAQAQYKQKLLNQIEDIGWNTKQWAALMTILERVYPEDFKRPDQKTSVTVNVGLFEKRVHEVTANEDDVIDAEVYDGG